jgi:nitrate reductase gamma subunit
MLWERGVGIRWPAINQGIADYLTLLAIVTSLALFVQRVSAKASRALSRLQDYVLPLLISVPFITGYLAMHPWLNPFGYQGTMFIHVMSGNLIILLIPFTKLAHVALLPTNQLVSEVGWHFVLDAPDKVTKSLGKEGVPI